MLSLFLLTLACGGQKREAEAYDCEVVATEALPPDADLDERLVDGLARYATLAGTWDLSLSCADGSTASVAVAITLAEREDLVLETWDGESCGRGSFISGTTAVRLSGWTHDLDATVDTTISMDDSVWLSGGASSVEFELHASEARINGTVRVPWPAEVTVDEVGSSTVSDFMDCTFEGWSPVE